jgi:hypothetical protein
VCEPDSRKCSGMNKHPAPLKLTKRRLDVCARGTTSTTKFPKAPDDESNWRFQFFTIEGGGLQIIFFYGKKLVLAPKKLLLRSKLRWKKKKNTGARPSVASLTYSYSFL